MKIEENLKRHIYLWGDVLRGSHPLGHEILQSAKVIEPLIGDACDKNNQQSGNVTKSVYFQYRNEKCTAPGWRGAL